MRSSDTSPRVLSASGPVSEPDFIAHLQARWRLQPDAALEALASWLRSYEPLESRRIRVLERRRPVRQRGARAPGAPKER